MKEIMAIVRMNMMNKTKVGGSFFFWYKGMTLNSKLGGMNNYFTSLFMNCVINNRYKKSKNRIMILSKVNGGK